MPKRKKSKSVIKLAILLISLVLLANVLNLTLSRYESVGNATAELEIARFLLNADYQTMTINLDSIVPSDEAYIYTFSISNYDEDIITDTVISYDLTIRTTTNLPLTYELYINGDTTQSAITENTIIQDDDNTYFRKITTDSVVFGFDEKLENDYTLIVNFPSIYSSTEYQDVVEAIEITINAEQVTE